MKHYDILIVDDEQRYADMLARRLELRGCSCRTCYSGQEAIRIVGQEKFFLILLDLQLPDVYGTEVLTRIRQIRADMPVIIITGHGTEKDRLECMQQGAYAFVHKPLDIERLLVILAEIRKVSV